jgi:hypothetical protein
MIQRINGPEIMWSRDQWSKDDSALPVWVGGVFMLLLFAFLAHSGGRIF